MSESFEPMYCVNHPQVETSLRCSRCNRPVCPKCVVATPTGYKCKDCIRGQQKIFETAQWSDYPIAFITAGLLSFLGSLLASYLGFFVILIAPLAGGIIAEIIRFISKHRRSRLLFQVIALATALGSVPLLGVLVIRVLAPYLLGGGANLFSFLPLVWQGIYSVVVTSTVYYRLKGIEVRF
jgi:hypothetical protein